MLNSIDSSSDADFYNRKVNWTIKLSLGNIGYCEWFLRTGTTFGDILVVKDFIEWGRMGGRITKKKIPILSFKV